MSIVPSQMIYNQLQTKAFYSVFKQWPIQPVNNGGQYWPGQVIRIFLTALSDGVLDPYRTHVEITVQCDQQTLPVGLLQIDNSAQSFIQQLVIVSKNRQVERILQYGVLAAYLTDIGLSQLYAQGRQSEGLGFNNTDNTYNIYNQSQGNHSGLIGVVNSTSSVVPNQALSNNLAFPTIPFKHQGASTWGGQSTPLTSLSGVYRGHLNWLNPAWLGTSYNQVWYWYDYVDGDPSKQHCTDNILTTQLLQYGYLNNLRAEYLSTQMINDFCDSTSSYAKHDIRLNLNSSSTVFPPKYSNSTVYQTYLPDNLPFYMNVTSSTGGNNFANMLVPNSTNLWGFSNLISPNYAKGVRQPFISPTVGQCQMQNGLILPQKIPVSTRTFKFPLISSVIGVLIPQSQFILIPLRTLNDTYLEMTIDPHAMFTSGYNDVSEFDDVGMGLMQKRAFQVTRVVYNLHTYQFYSAQMDQYIRININSGIAITTQFWQLANQYSIENSQSITNAWPVACNQEALSEVLTLFYSLDYQRFSFCRKHFRLSNNIKRFQCRINMEYYPSQPFSGNGGNPIALDESGDNSIFIQQILYSTGYKFSNIAPLPRINNYNFAINSRCYNPTNGNTFYDPQMIGTPGYVWTPASINCDTALGMSHVHQNRYVGKAAYLFSFQPYSHSKDTISGIDCRKTKQFDIIFGAGNQGYYQGPQMMFIYTKSTNVIEFGKEGIVNINK